MQRCFAALTTFLCCLVAIPTHADDKAATSTPSPAKVENRVKESDLTTIKITPEAEKRLGIQLATAESKPISKVIQLPAEAVIPPGRRIVVAAPIAGLLTAADANGVGAIAGLRIERGAQLYRLQPGEAREGRAFVPADRISLARARADLAASRIDAEGQLAQARVRVEAASVKLKRADQLRQEGAGAQRGYDDARAESDLAASQEKAAQERVETLAKLLTSLESSEQSALPIESPLNGFIQTVHATPGQVVASGAPLIEIVAFDPVWVRVPVYVGDLQRLESADRAQVRGLGESSTQPGREARRVAAPPSADPRAATVDLYFELPNGDATLRPGQRVQVDLATPVAEASLVVPHAAILFDIHGGTWVYEATGPQTYVRRRVEVQSVVGDAAVLKRGISTGVKVVTAGAAELFGTEFGVGK